MIPLEILHAESKGAIEVIHAQTAHDALFDIQLEGKNGWAVGDHGLLLMSQDEGHTWRSISLSTDRALLGLDVIPSGAGVIVGQEGTILRASHGGTDWSIVETDTSARLFSVDLDVSGFGLAVGEFGTLLRTSDYGKSWTSLTPDWNLLLGHEDIPHLYDVLVEDPHTVLVVGEFETIMFSEDAGETWSVLNQGDASLFALIKMSSGRYWCMGQSGLLMHSGDQGRTWKTINVGEQLELLDMYIDASGGGVLVGLGKLFFTTDAGTSWHSDPALSLPFPWYQAVAANPAGHYLLVGAFGSIIRIIKVTGPK